MTNMRKGTDTIPVDHHGTVDRGAIVGCEQHARRPHVLSCEGSGEGEPGPDSPEASPAMRTAVLALAAMVALCGAALAVDGAPSTQLAEGRRALEALLAEEGVPDYETHQLARAYVLSDFEAAKGIIQAAVLSGDKQKVAQALHLARRLPPRELRREMVPPKLLLGLLKPGIDPGIRRAAAWHVHWCLPLDPSLAPRMRLILADSDSTVARSALRFFECLPPDLATRDALVRMATQEKAAWSDQRARAARLLGWLGDRSVLPILKEHETALGLQGLIARAALGDPAVASAVLKMVDEPRGSSRTVADAVRALGGLTDDETKGALLCFLDNRSYLVRLAAIDALTRRKERDAIPYLIPMLDSRTYLGTTREPKPPKLTDRALAALRKLTGMEGLTSPEEWRVCFRRESAYIDLIPRDVDFETEFRYLLRLLGGEFSNWYATKRICELGEKALEPLRSIALDPRDMRSAGALHAIEALGQKGYDRAWEILAEVIKQDRGPPPWTGTNTSEQAIAILIRNGRDPMPLIKNMIVRGGYHSERGLGLLRRLGKRPPSGGPWKADARALAIFERYLYSPDTKVRATAVQSLSRLVERLWKEEYGFPRSDRWPEALPDTYDYESWYDWLTANHGRWSPATAAGTR